MNDQVNDAFTHRQKALALFIQSCVQKGKIMKNDDGFGFGLGSQVVCGDENGFSEYVVVGLRLVEEQNSLQVTLKASTAAHENYSFNIKKEKSSE